MAEEKKGAHHGRLLLHNTMILAAGRLGSKLLVFFLVRLYTHILTNEEYGSADLITSLTNFLIPLACAGLSCGFFRFAVDAIRERKSVTCFTSGLILLLLSSAVFLALSPLLSFIPYISGYVWLIAVYVLAANLHYLVSEFVRARGQYTLYSVQGILNTLLNIGFNLLFLLPLRLGVTGYVLSVACADLAVSAFLFFYCRLWRYVAPRTADRALMREMLRYCLPLVPSTLCWWITNVSDRYMVTYLCGEAENGLYAAAYKIPNLLTIACNVFLDAWQFSAISERLSGEENPENPGNRQKHLSLFFESIFRHYNAFLFFGTGGLILFSRLISLLLFDASFEDAWQYVPTLLLATLLSSQNSFIGTVYLVYKRSLPTLVTSLCGAVVNILLNFWLIPDYGGLGAAIATALSYGLCLLLRLWDSRRLLPFPLHPLRLCICLTLTVALTWYMTAEAPFWMFVCGGIYIGICVFTLPSLLHSLKELKNR